MGNRPGLLSHRGRWGSPGASCSGSAGSSAPAPPWVQAIGGSAQAWRLLLSPLSSKSLQQPIPRRGSQRTQKICLPITWDTGFAGSLSQCSRWGSVSTSQPWEAPKPSGLSPAQGAGPALSLLCPLVVSGAQAGGTQPGSVTQWTLSHTHLAGNSNTVGTKGATWLPCQSC